MDDPIAPCGSEVVTGVLRSSSAPHLCPPPEPARLASPPPAVDAAGPMDAQTRPQALAKPRRRGFRTSAHRPRRLRPTSRAATWTTRGSWRRRSRRSGAAAARTASNTVYGLLPSVERAIVEKPLENPVRSYIRPHDGVPKPPGHDGQSPHRGPIADQRRRSDGGVIGLTRCTSVSVGHRDDHSLSTSRRVGTGLIGVAARALGDRPPPSGPPTQERGPRRRPSRARPLSGSTRWCDTLTPPPGAGESARTGRRGSTRPR